MAGEEAARRVLEAVGGSGNVVSCDVCMTRLRLSLHDVSMADMGILAQVPGVLGVAPRGTQGIDVVFGPAMVEDVHESMAVLLGGTKAGGAGRAQAKAPQAGQISPGRRKSYRAQARALARRGGTSAELERILDQIDANERTATVGPRLLVINGPNLNMLGVREPDIYGRQDYAALVELCHVAGREAGFSDVRCYQSNHEGDIVDEIQRALHTADGIVINPGGYTHTSVAILDALKAVQLPAVEVHISKVDEREEFRQVSYVRLACFETVTGLGLKGYRKAIRDLADHIASLRK